MKPVVTGREIDSFYHLSDVPMQHRRCRGTACFACKHLDPEGWKRTYAEWPPVYCLGKCYASPATTEVVEDPRVEIHCADSIVLGGVVDRSMRSLGDYRSNGGYKAFEKVIANPPENFISQLETSKLRGCGGAGFPTGRKWRAVHEQTAPIKYVVANADEGDHGSYIDRFIIERTPHRLIEALAISGYVVGASKGYIYLRKEYPVADQSIRAAIEEIHADGLLGDFTLKVVTGQGSYLCGEETSLLNSIEHQRPEVRTRPPYPFQKGLFGEPTLVNNVETLAAIPWIATRGGDAFAARGFSRSHGTKAVSLNSLFNRPGLYEVEFGTPLRTIIEDIGGGLKSGEIKAVSVGGPLVGLVHPREFDTQLGFEEMWNIGAAVGHGGIVAFDHNTRMDELLAYVFEFGAFESCGKCTPCRLGSRRAFEMFDKIRGGDQLSKAETNELKYILDAMRRTSLCGHGAGLATFATSVLFKFDEELEPCFE